jgi:hypothetical protein
VPESISFGLKIGPKTFRLARRVAASLWVDLEFAGLSDRMGSRSYFGPNRRRWNGNDGRRPLLRRRIVAASLECRPNVDDLLASRRWRHIADARRFRGSDECRIEIMTAIDRGLFRLNWNPVRVGECILTNAGHLPGNLHIRFVSPDDELMIRDLACDDRLRELSEHCKLIAEIAIECLEPFGQLDRCLAACVRGDVAVVDIHHVGRFDKGVIEMFIRRIERVVDLERSAAFGERP